MKAIYDWCKLGAMRGPKADIPTGATLERAMSLGNFKDFLKTLGITESSVDAQARLFVSNPELFRNFQRRHGNAVLSKWTMWATFKHEDLPSTGLFDGLSAIEIDRRCALDSRKHVLKAGFVLVAYTSPLNQDRCFVPTVAEAYRTGEPGGKWPRLFRASRHPESRWGMTAPSRGPGVPEVVHAGLDFTDIDEIGFAI